MHISTTQLSLLLCCLVSPILSNPVPILHPKFDVNGKPLNGAAVLQTKCGNIHVVCPEGIANITLAGIALIGLTIFGLIAYNKDIQPGLTNRVATKIKIYYNCNEPDESEMEEDYEGIPIDQLLPDGTRKPPGDGDGDDKNITEESTLHDSDHDVEGQPLLPK